MFWSNPTTKYQPDINSLYTPDFIICHLLFRSVLAEVLCTITISHQTINEQVSPYFFFVIVSVRMCVFRWHPIDVWCITRIMRPWPGTLWCSRRSRNPPSPTLPTSQTLPSAGCVLFFVLLVLLVGTPTSVWAGPQYSLRVVQTRTGLVRGVILHLNSRRLAPVEVSVTQSISPSVCIYTHRNKFFFA